MAHVFRRLLKLHFVISGVIVNLAVIAALVFFGKALYQLHLPFPVLAERLVIHLEGKSPALSERMNAGFNALGVLEAGSTLYGKIYHIDPGSEHWNGRGANPAVSFPPQSYDAGGRPVIVERHSGRQSTPFAHGPGKDHEVSNVESLSRAIEAAQPGDRIVLAPGEYRISNNIEIRHGGTRDEPITLAAERLGQVRLLVSSTQGFLVRAPYWVFENLEMQGVCASDGACEHAYHIVGAAHGTVIRNNRLFDFNSMIKINGETQSGRRQFPDDGLIESSSLYNHSVRDTDNPVTPIDIVASNGWVIRNSLIADFAKGRGDRTSYAAFAKGDASGTLFERNIVICQLNVRDGRDVRVGLSFGGGGTDRSACRDRRCSYEHNRGVIRNNVIMHCPSDVGIYLNKAHSTEIYNNTLYHTLGIDVRFPESTAVVFNNILSGRVDDRNGGLSIRTSNLVADFSNDLEGDVFHDWFQLPEAGNFKLVDGSEFVNRGRSRDELKYDFCGNPRKDRAVDIGAFEYAGDRICLPLGQPSR